MFLGSAKAFRFRQNISACFLAEWVQIAAGGEVEAAAPGGSTNDAQSSLNGPAGETTDLDFIITLRFLRGWPEGEEKDR